MKTIMKYVMCSIAILLILGVVAVPAIADGEEKTETREGVITSIKPSGVVGIVIVQVKEDITGNIYEYRCAESALSGAKVGDSVKVKVTYIDENGNGKYDSWEEVTGIEFTVKPSVQVLVKNCVAIDAKTAKITVKFKATDVNGDMAGYQVTADGYSSPYYHVVGNEQSSMTKTVELKVPCGKNYKIKLRVDDYGGNVVIKDPPVFCPCVKEVPAITPLSFLLALLSLLGLGAVAMRKMYKR